MRRRFDTTGIAIEPTELEGLEWPRLFGRVAPVEVEIGTGKGGFLLKRAREHPEIDFLGIEWANKFFRFAADRMRRWGLTNVRMVRTDASHFIRNQCPRNSLSMLHIYHPDPWPKKRHHKRRLFQRPFVEAAVQCLVEGGRIAVQTDHAEYFGIIRELLLGHGELEEVDFAEAAQEGDLGTNFEVKYRREGRDIYRLAVRRRSTGRRCTDQRDHNKGDDSCN